MSPSTFPYIVTGKVTDSDGSNPNNAPIVIRNDRTIESITINTDSNGDYVGDLSNLSSGWNVGDQITVVARFGLEDGESSFTIASDEANQTVDITTSEIVASSDVSYCTIEEVYDELDGKTTNDITATRVRNAIIRSEGYIDMKTKTSFKSNTITDEFYDTNDETMWSSPESRLYLFNSGNGLSRSDNALSGAIDRIQLKNKPVISITSLSKNTAGTTETDTFTTLTEQSGSGGDFILTDAASGIIDFINNKPAFGKKRAFKVSYTWGLDRDSTDRDDIAKKETVRELCILLSVRTILTSKASSSQFSSVDDISLESISISKGVGQSVTYMDQLKERIEELFNALGVFNISGGLS